MGELTASGRNFTVAGITEHEPSNLAKRKYWRGGCLESHLSLGLSEAELFWAVGRCLPLHEIHSPESSPRGKHFSLFFQNTGQESAISVKMGQKKKKRKGWCQLPFIQLFPGWSTYPGYRRSGFNSLFCLRRFKPISSTFQDCAPTTSL